MLIDRVLGEDVRLYGLERVRVPVFQRVEPSRVGIFLELRLNDQRRDEAVLFHEGVVELVELLARRDDFGGRGILKL